MLSCILSIVYAQLYNAQLVVYLQLYELICLSLGVAASRWLILLLQGSCCEAQGDQDEVSDERVQFLVASDVQN